MVIDVFLFPCQHIVCNMAWVASFPGSLSHTVHKTRREPGRFHQVHDDYNDVLCTVCDGTLCVTRYMASGSWEGEHALN